jgi:hypothetical protein
MKSERPMKSNNKKDSSKKNPSYKSTMHFLASRVFISTLLCVFLTSAPAHSGLFDWLFGKSKEKKEETLQENVEIETTPENDTSWTDEKVEYLTRYTKLRDWIAPDFQNQTQALGYDEKTFEIPEEGYVLTPDKFYLGVTAEYTETHAHAVIRKSERPAPGTSSTSDRAHQITENPMFTPGLPLPGGVS